MKRKWLSIIVLILTLCMLPVPAVAAEKGEDELLFALNRAASCITKSEYVPQKSVTLSNPIPQYESMTGNLVANIYLMFDGDEHIGLVLVSPNEGNRCATAYLCNYPVLETAKSVGSRVVFYQENGCFTVHINGERSVLKNPDRVTNFSTLEIEDGYIISDVAIVSLHQNRSIYYSLDVDIIANESLNGGICWAASLASKINYQKGTDLNARDVYNECVRYWDMSDMSNDNPPRGVPEWYQIAAGLYHVNMTYIERPITSEGRFVTCFRNGTPIIMRIRTEDEALWHAVVNCGIEEDAEFYELKLMDPNDDVYVYASIPNDFFETQEGFYYNAGYAIYTKWVGTFY